MSEALNPPSSPPVASRPASEDAPNAHGKFSISEDWLAVVVGLVLLTAALVGLIPVGLVP